MADLPEHERTTAEERERYGQQIEARNDTLENKEILPESRVLADHEIPPPLTANKKITSAQGASWMFLFMLAMKPIVLSLRINIIIKKHWSE